MTQTQPISVTQTAPTVEGGAVYRFRYGMSCEEHGAPHQNTKGACPHIRAVEQKEVPDGRREKV